MPDLVQVVAEFDLAEAGDLTRCGFVSVDTRPLVGVDEYGPRYAYVTNLEELVLFHEEEEVAGTLNLVITKGATFAHTFRWQNRDGSAVDLTGATALLQVRAEESSTSTHILSLASYAQPGGGPSPWYQDITINGSLGELVINTDASDTAGLTAGEYYYDIKIVMSGSEVYYLVEGQMTVDAAVSA